MIGRTWVPGDNTGIGCRASGVVGIDLDRHGGPGGVAVFASCQVFGGHVGGVEGSRQLLEAASGVFDLGVCVLHEVTLA